MKSKTIKLIITIGFDSNKTSVYIIQYHIQYIWQKNVFMSILLSNKFSIRILRVLNKVFSTFDPVEPLKYSGIILFHVSYSVIQ